MPTATPERYTSHGIKPLDLSGGDPTALVFNELALASVEGKPGAVEKLKRAAANQYLNGTVQNFFADVLNNQLGIPTEYADPNRPASDSGFTSVLGTIDKAAAAAALGGAGGAALGAVGAGAAAGAGGGGATAGGGSGLGSLLGGGSTLDKIGRVAKLGLSALGTIQGAKKYGEAGRLTQEQLAQARAQQTDRDKLRQRLMGRLGTIPGRPNLGSLFAGSQNPFARKTPVSAPSASPESPAPFGSPVANQGMMTILSRARAGLPRLPTPTAPAQPGANRLNPLLQLGGRLGPLMRRPNQLTLPRLN